MKTCKKCGYINLTNVPACGSCGASGDLIDPMRVLEIKQSNKVLDLIPVSVLTGEDIDGVLLDDLTDEPIVYTMTFKNVERSDFETFVREKALEN